MNNEVQRGYFSIEDEADFSLEALMKMVKRNG